MIRHNDYLIEKIDLTKREFLVCISIVFLYITFLCGITNLLDKHYSESRLKYARAFVVDSNSTKYAIETESGTFFSDGELKVVDPVYTQYATGEFDCLRFVTEEYRSHVKTETYRVNGKTHHRIKVYHSWDMVEQEVKECKGHDFNGVFINTKLYSSIQWQSHLSTISLGHNRRLVVYGVASSIKNGSAYIQSTSDGINEFQFFENRQSEDIRRELLNDTSEFVMKVCVIVFLTICFIISLGVFVLHENEWLYG